MIKSYKTTLTGVIAGAALVVLNLVQTGTTDAKTLAVAFGIAFLGAFSKDHDVTGVK